MKERIHDFIIGLFSPALLLTVDNPDSFNLNFWIDQVAFLICSIVTGLAVMYFSKWFQKIVKGNNKKK